MSWLTGTTTWGNCVSDLTKLIAGEMADGNGVTNAVGDRWIREIAGQDLLRTPASQDVTLGNMNNRMGYFAQLRFANATANSSGSLVADTTFVRLTNIFTSNPSTTAGRWVVRVTVTTANTTAGNYSTAQWSYNIYDADTDASVASASSLTMTSAGVATLPNGAQITFGSATGFLTLNTVFARGFTTTYVGGIDWWGPFYPRRSGAHSFSANPSGTSGTDWDVVEIPCGATNPVVLIYGNVLQGLGIKTNTGLSGNLYTVTWPAAFNKIRLQALSGASNGIITLHHGGGGKVDTVYQNPTMRSIGGFQIAQWLRPFQTPASVTSGAAVQYWMSVTPTKIAIILQGDPAFSGKSTSAFITKLQGAHSYDKFPVITTTTTKDYTVDNATTTAHVCVGQISLYGQMLRQNGSEGGRDWQTGWMRTDFNGVANGTDSFGEAGVGKGYGVGTGAHSFYPVGFYCDMTVMSVPAYVLMAARTTKPHAIDNKWWFFGAWWTESPGTASTVESLGIYPRGYTTDPSYIPGTGWGNTDEFTDTVTDKTYFLIGADHPGWHRVRVGTNSYVGGTAFLEE